MLKQRVITALVLLALLVPALLTTNPWPFNVLTLALIGAAGWEWGRLNAAGRGLSVAFGIVLVGAGAAAWHVGWTSATPSVVWWTTAALWIAGGSLALHAGPAGWPTVPRAARWAIGLLALWSAWLAIGASRTHGLSYVMSIFCLVWVADIAAYFGGRTWGRRKLAPTISPGKTWEGAWSGAIGVLALAATWLGIEGSSLPSQSIFSDLRNGFGWLGGMLGVAGLAAMSVVGDLFESLVKRAAGAKDSSRLLPGHGGVLDRVDALLPVFPMALALSTMGHAT